MAIKLEIVWPTVVNLSRNLACQFDYISLGAISKLILKDDLQRA